MSFREVSPIKQDPIIESHSSVSTISDDISNSGLSVRRATGTTYKDPPSSTNNHVEESHTWLNDSRSQKSLTPMAVSSSRKRKVVQQGIIKKFAPMKVALVAESLPWWILALDSTRIDSICFPEFSSWDNMERSLASSSQGAALLTTLRNLSLKRLLFRPQFETVALDLWLICGSLKFFSDVSVRYQTISRWIFCTESHQRLRKLPDFPCRLHRITHSKQGGPTSFEMLWASSHLSSVESSPLVRTIADYLDFSVRPKPCGYPPVENHMLATGVIPVRGIFSKVCYSTPFSSTGWGLRPLTPNELSLIFGIPSRFLSGFTRDCFPIPPVQILDVLLESWMLKFSSVDNKIQKLEPLIPTPPPVSDSMTVYFPAIKRSLPQNWAKTDLIATKAAKADNASVSESLWDQRIVLIWPKAVTLLSFLRKLVLRRQRRLLYIEFQRYLSHRYGRIRDEYFSILYDNYGNVSGNQVRGESTTVYTYVDDSAYSSKKIKQNQKALRALKFYHLRRDVRVGIKGLQSICESSFFNWDRGSTLLFWRWHPEIQRFARDGFPAQISRPLPNSFKKSRAPKAQDYPKILSKLVKGLTRGYLVSQSFSKISNLIDFFAVPKADDIRLVQNGSSCGLNEAVWASNFWLPNAASMTRVLGFNYKAVDLDLGEMFLNFPLDKKLVSFSGMDLTPYKKDLSEFYQKTENENNAKFYVVNERNWMGLRPSPEWSCRFYYLAEEFIRGNEKEKDNPLRWDRVILNLIGNPDFNPALPNVFKWNASTLRLAGEIKAYVDDLRALGWSLEHSWSIAHLIASRLQFLGIQDAPRKRIIDQGPWAGSIYLARNHVIQKTVSKEKWDKAKSYVHNIKRCLEKDKNFQFDYKYLEQVRGFLCHLALTFEVIFPFLKGFHLTLCSHLPSRNEEGWKISELEWLAYLEDKKCKGSITDEEINQIVNAKYDPKARPRSVRPLPRFSKSISALHTLFSCEDPPLVTVRTSDIQFIIYGFADASKSGFGASIAYVDSVRYRVGTWSNDEDDCSSNFREFANIVETVEEEVRSGRLQHSTLILATDNSTVESALFKGNSTSELLYDLIVRFKTAELQSGSRFIVTHVSGERMKYQGTDGISRGQLREGISLGNSMLKYCPWGLSAIDRSPSLMDWCKNVFGPNLEILSPCEWFTRGHDHNGGYYDQKGMYRLNIKHGTYLWQPPPAAADAALEEIRKARLKRRSSTHVIIIPRLCTTLWLKQLYKAADIVLYLPCSYSHWSSLMFEPLVIGILFPYSRFYPWQLKGSPRLCTDRRKMQSLLQAGEVDSGDLLRKFFISTRKIPSLSEHLVRQLLFFGEAHGVPYSSAGGIRGKRKRFE